MISNWLATKKAKSILLQAFKAGDLSISFSYGQNKGVIYPKIRRVKIDQKAQALIYHFSIPTGMDPKELKKKMYCFHQVFGKNIELKGDIKEFKLTVFAASLPSELTYDYEQYATHFRGLKLPIVAGMDLHGSLIVYDMATDPHLLIAGETGSGKSTQLRSVLTTLIKALPPEELHLYLFDLKRSEFHVFRQVEHVQGVYVSPSEMLPVFQSLQREMKRRGDLLDSNELTNVYDLPKPPPNIVVCIDEVALLQKQNAIMELVEEISAIGRALGVFLILSMQRPDSKILDGKLKNNLTVRMGFRCADLINSRIIGTPGSEKLKEKGRMLLKLSAYSDLKEIQAPFLSLSTAKELLEGYRSPKPKGRSKSPLNAEKEGLETKENHEGIFEVLDE